jgi:hypothetical protein
VLWCHGPGRLCCDQGTDFGLFMGWRRNLDIGRVCGDARGFGMSSPVFEGPRCIWITGA